MRAFWLMWLLVALPLDYWCHRTGHITLTRTIVEAIPAVISLPLAVWGILHLAGYYFERSGR